MNLGKRYTATRFPKISPEEIEAFSKLSDQEKVARGAVLEASLPPEDFTIDFVYSLIAEFEHALNWRSADEKATCQSAIMDVLFEGLLPAREHLQRIEDAPTPPISERHRKMAYEDFTRACWHAYKDLSQRAARTLGVDIGFIFQKDAKFESGIAILEAQITPLWFIDKLKAQRLWLSDFGTFRNYLEHKDEEGALRFDRNYDLRWARITWTRIWNACFDACFVTLLERLPYYFLVVQTPKESRDAEYPTRLRLVYHPLYHCRPYPEDRAWAYDA